MTKETEVFYRELISTTPIASGHNLTNLIAKYPEWHHKVVGYSITETHRTGFKSSILIKFWKEVNE